ncbi:hypothetical protein SYNTR_0102 [Candidatus Syntrophocurvum alkaliphilum]|uniref:Uncharacterized protein n=1 Tax=Candidatus Syntrophocurvum alkaliphilum TaxID=2293317 RepID=A0A6I6DB67_9FIRM|nr:DUF6512 family protein [Candidatus Syntrophocurvum alkaliphilum]QGT98695.1 hypothetical protein SYNTR_0102 [Candidatus Syntrophocurvum alkaliphilum]
MARLSIKYILLKAVIFLIVYTIFHFSYDFLQLKIFAVSESVWQHLKIGLFAAVLIGLIEVIILTIRGNVIFIQNLLFSRIISSLLVPLIIFLFFYLLIALFGKITPTIVELIANIAIVFFAGIIAFYIENEILELPVYEKPILLWIFIIMLVIASYLFLAFTENPPYYPLFVER